ncbi:MAG TPA: SIMPL domain-containing protein [Ferruginibacter sp.]|nr:SIMPL domain-containing protein [Ferruginibacter sp.]
MKKIILSAAILIVIAFNGFSQTKNFIDQPFIEVNGYADTFVIPNEIFIKIVISERDSKNKISVEETESKMVEGFKKIGINTEKDLTTNDLGSNYRFYFLKNKEVMKIKQYILKVQDAVTASKVFILLEDLDISNTSIDRVNHSEMERFKSMMSARAVENAKAKAVTLTRPLGQMVGPAINIIDHEISSTAENSLQGRVAGLQLRGTSTYDKFQGELPKIEFERIKVSSGVNVKFILK